MSATKTKPTERITKRNLTLTEAADQWERGKRMADEAKALMKEAAPVVLAHLIKTGKSNYKGRIGISFPPPRTILDQDKIREYLGAKIKDFQKKSKPGPSLTLLDQD